MDNLDVLTTIRETINICFKSEGIEECNYCTIALVLEKQGGVNPDLIMYYGAVNESLKEDVIVYGEKTLIPDIGAERFLDILSLVHEEYKSNFSPIITKMMLDITNIPNTYDGLISAIDYCFSKGDFSRTGIGFRIVFDIDK